jgi:hypothetical protein
MIEGAQWQQKLWKPVVHNFTSYQSFPEKSEYTIPMSRPFPELLPQIFRSLLADINNLNIILASEILDVFQSLDI